MQRKQPSDGTTGSESKSSNVEVCIPSKPRTRGRKRGIDAEEDYNLADYVNAEVSYCIYM
jgi:hypothetical protein